MLWRVWGYGLRCVWLYAPSSAGWRAECLLGSRGKAARALLSSGHLVTHATYLPDSLPFFYPLLSPTIASYSCVFPTAYCRCPPARSSKP